MHYLYGRLLVAQCVRCACGTRTRLLANIESFIRPAAAGMLVLLAISWLDGALRAVPSPAALIVAALVARLALALSAVVHVFAQQRAGHSSVLRSAGATLLLREPHRRMAMWQCSSVRRYSLP